MPEMPEVQGLVDFLRGRVARLRVDRVTLASFAALRTFDPPIDALRGASVRDAQRHGKFVDLVTHADGDEDDRGIRLIFHLAKAGWLRWHDVLPATSLKPGRSPIALRVAFDDGSGFDLTEAGTRKALAVYVVRSPDDVPGIARLGPDPLSDAFTVDVLSGILAGRRAQLKGILRDQSTIAGIGNAYSDEILNVARMSPYAPAGSLSPDEVRVLFDAIRGTLGSAVAAASGRPPTELKDAKRGGMRVHGRAGEACPACGDTVRSVFFADRSMEYCPTCQTGGKALADRRLSRLLK